MKIHVGDLVAVRRDFWSEEEKDASPIEIGLVKSIDAYPPIVSWADGELIETPSRNYLVMWTDGDEEVYHENELMLIKTKKVLDKSTKP